MRRAALLLLLAACSEAPVVVERAAVPLPPTTSSTTASTTPPAAVEVRYRIDVRTDQPDFAPTVEAVLSDPRGWERAGFRLERRREAAFSVVLAEPDDAHELCKPYDVYRKYSCQNGPMVVLNAERWRQATSEWTGDLAAYRIMLVNHEVGHLLGQQHPEVQCPGVGQLAPVMAQQSTELNGCLPNPWPLDAEITRAAHHDLPLAPPYEPQ